MKQPLYALMLLVAVALGGCQVMGADPLAGGAGTLPAACQWPREPAASREAWVRAAMAELEARGFAIRSTDLTLGVVSAERTTRQPGLGAIDEPWIDGGMGWGGWGHAGGGVNFGLGMRIGDDPVQVERVSLVVDEAQVTLTRDSRVVADDGRIIDARPYSRDAFCREVSGAIQSRLLNREGQP